MRIKVVVIIAVSSAYALLLGFHLYDIFNRNYPHDRNCYDKPCVRFCCNENEAGCSDQEIIKDFDVVKLEIGGASSSDDLQVMRGALTCSEKRKIQTTDTNNGSWEVYYVS